MISIVPAPLSAKGNTVKITIKGAGITTPLEITDPKIREFHVWAGPGDCGDRRLHHRVVKGRRRATPNRTSTL
jgi:hypothetical protein